MMGWHGYDDDLSCYRYCDVVYTVSDGASFDIPMAGGTGFSGSPAIIGGTIAAAAALPLLYFLMKRERKNRKHHNAYQPGIAG